LKPYINQLMLIQKKTQVCKTPSKREAGAQTPAKKTIVEVGC